MKYKYVNARKYVNEILWEGTKLKEYRKFAKVKAEQGQENQIVVTKMKNGLVETINKVKIDEITKQADWIVTNPDGEQYIVPDKTFRERYELKADINGYHKPKNTVIKAIQINENISFDSSLGRKMKIRKGGYLVVNSPTNIYSIQKDEFKNTYLPKEKVEKLLNE